MCITGATVVCGISIAVCSFCSPFGYRGCYTQRRRKDDKKLKADRGKLSYHNAGWFSISSLMKMASIFVTNWWCSGSAFLLKGFWILQRVSFMTSVAYLNLMVGCSRKLDNITKSKPFRRHEKLTFSRPIEIVISYGTEIIINRSENCRKFSPANRHHHNRERIHQSSMLRVTVDAIDQCG